MTNTGGDGPDFNSEKLGCIDFDGTNDYINCGNVTDANGLSTMSCCIWAKLDTVNPNETYISKWKQSSPRQSCFSIITANVGDTPPTELRVFVAINLTEGGGNYVDTTDAPLTENWQYISVVYDGSLAAASRLAIYVDGVKSATTVTYGTIPTSLTSSSADLEIGRWEGMGDHFAGNIASVSLYTRALSVDEVKQNYEATKPRFTPRITKSNLELNLDAGDPASYVGGTTWKDTANGYNATLVNTIYSSEGGGSMDLDGTDDSVTISSNAAGDFSMKGWSILTYEFWIKRTDTTGWGRLLYESTQTSGGFLVGPAFSGSNYYAYIDTDDGSSMGYVGGWGSTTDWIHLVTTYDGSNVVTYRNGVQVGTQSLTGDIKNTSGSYGGVVFGRTNHGGSDWFDGRVATIRVYQAALSAAEILDNYNKTKARFGH